MVRKLQVQEPPDGCMWFDCLDWNIAHTDVSDGPVAAYKACLWRGPESLPHECLLITFLDSLIEKWPSGVSDNLVHEPLLIGGAGLPKGVVYEEMAEMIDLVPTLLQFGTVNETYAHYGKSLVDAIHAAGRGEVLPHRDFAYTEGGFLLSDEPLLEQSPFPYDIKAALQHNDTALVGKALAVRNKEWTYIYRLYEDDELYSRTNDPREIHNLAAKPKYAHVVMKMHKTALHWMISTPNTIPWVLDERMPNVTLETPFEQYQERCNNCTFDEDWPGPGMPTVPGVAAITEGS